MSNKINKNNIKNLKKIKHLKHKFTKKLKPSIGGYLSTITPYKNIAGEEILPIPGTDLDLQYFYGLGSNPPKNITTPGKTIEYKTHENGNRDAVQFMFPMYNFKLNFAKKLKDKVDSYAILKQFEGDESYYIVDSNSYNPETSKFFLLKDDLSLQEIPNPAIPANPELIKDDNVNYKNTNNETYNNFFKSKLLMDDIKNLVITKVKMYSDIKTAKIKNIEVKEDFRSNIILNKDLNTIFTEPVRNCDIVCELISKLYRYEIDENHFLIDTIKKNDNIFILLLFLNEIHTFYNLINKCIEILNKKKNEQKLEQKINNIDEISSKMANELDNEIKKSFYIKEGKQYVINTKIAHSFYYYNFINEFGIEKPSPTNWDKILKKNIKDVFTKFIFDIKEILILLLKIEFLYPSLSKYIISDFILRLMNLNYIENFLLSKRKIWTTLFNENNIYKIDEKQYYNDSYFNKKTNELKSSARALYNKNHYADCVEASLFNLFINLLNKDITGFRNNNEDDLKFNIEKLPKDTPIYNFFKKYETFDNLKTQFNKETSEVGNVVKNEWVVLLNNIPDVRYMNVDYELDSIPENILKVLNHLMKPVIFATIEDFITYFFKQKPNIEIVGGKYNINKMIELNIMPGHCSLTSLENNQQSLNLINELDNNHNIQTIDFINKLNNNKFNIIYCYHNKYINYLQYLMQDKSNINAVNEYGITALMYAIKENSRFNKKFITDLIKYGANINASDKNGMTVLMYAISYYNIYDDNTNTKELIIDLIKNGANIDVVDNNGKTALMYAILRNKDNIYKELIIYLIKNGENINAFDKDGKTALMYASYKQYTVNNNNYIKLIIDFIKNGANFNAIDEYGKTFFMYLIENSNNECITDLIKFSENINTFDKDGKTVLMYALSNKDISLEIIKYLIEDRNADINAVDKNGETVLMYALYTRNTDTDTDNYIDLIKYLVEEKKLDINAFDKNGNIIFIIAILKYNKIPINLLDYLLDKKIIDINAVDKNGKNILLNIFDYTFDDTFDENALIHMFTYFINKGANINIVDKNGNTPLFYAKEKHLNDTIISLLTPSQPQPQLTPQLEQIPSGGYLSKYKRKLNRKSNRKLKTKEKHKSKYKTKIHKL